MNSGTAPNSTNHDTRSFEKKIVVLVPLFLSRKNSSFDSGTKTAWFVHMLAATGLQFVRVLKGRLYLVQFQLSTTIHLSTTHSA